MIIFIKNPECTKCTKIALLSLAPLGPETSDIGSVNPEQVEVR